MKEKWLPIRGHSGWYEVSDRGRVRSWKYSGRSYGRRIKPLIRKLVPNVKSNYLTVMLSRNGKLKLEYVHLLVLRTFVGPAPPNHVARHVHDNTLTNNRLTNLCWGTQEENIADAVRHGTHTLGEQNGGAKLTQAQANSIRQRVTDGEEGDALALEYGVSAATISRIKHRLRYTR